MGRTAFTSPSFAQNAKRLLRLAIPITVGQLAIVGMSVTDIIVAGRLSTEDLAGVTLGSSVFNLAIMLVVGIILANGPLVGQLFGAGKFEDIPRQLQSCLWLAVPLGLASVGFLVVTLALLPRLAPSHNILTICQQYIYPMFGTALLLPFMLALRTTFEGLGKARPAMVLNVLGFGLNIFLDVALVFGYWGFPKLGGAGCGWATLLVAAMIVLGEIIYARQVHIQASQHLLARWHWPDVARIKETLRVGLPIGGTMLAEGGFFLVIPLLIAHRGAVEVGGHAIALSFDWVMYMIPLGLAQAMSVLAAHELGHRQPTVARRLCLTGLIITVALALLQAALVIGLRGPIASLYSPDADVQALAASLLIYAAGFRIFDAINVAANGALRGYKDTRFPALLTIVGYWGIGFPLGYSLALTDWWGAAWGVEGFWAGTVIALIFIALLSIARFFKTSRLAIDQLAPANASAN